MNRGLACATTVALLASAPAAAAASPLADPFLGGVVFTGPTHAHPTAFFHNPAALGLDPGTHLYMASTVRLDQFGVDRAPIDADGAPGGTIDPGEVNSTLATPGGFTAIYSDFNGRRVTLGLAVYTPYAERFLPEEPELRYHTLGGFHYDVTATPAVSFRINQKFVIGMGVSLGFERLRLKFARDTALEAGTAGLDADCGGERCGAENPEAAETYNVETQANFSIGFHAGVVISLRNGWHLGAGYVSPTSSFGQLVVESTGTVRVGGAPRDGGERYAGQSRVIYKLPQTLHIGARGPILEDYELVVAARLHHTGRHEQWDLRMFAGDLDRGDIPEQYPRYTGLKTVLGLEAGIEAPERERVRLGGRLRLETAGISENNVAPQQNYGANVSLAAGAELRVTQRLAMSLGYAIVLFPGQSPNPSAFDPEERVSCVDQNYPIDACAATREGRGIPTAAGDYSRLQHAFSLGVRFDWF
jgi:hypothetical protein